LNTIGTYEAYLFQTNGWVPNNPDKPVLLYRAVLPDTPDAAAAVEQHFLARDWRPEWRGVVFDFHHYHSSAHEVLGCVSGHASIMMGGENGTTIELRKGDAVLIPQA
jgi:uncharacterized protein YjlB